MGNCIKVGMADMNICQAPDSITTLGLGSCVGVVLYDAKKKFAGMVHVMLPDSTAIRNNENVAKFADSGICELLKRMESQGTNRSLLTAKIAGGAQMFAFSSTNDMLRVGDRNVEAVKNVLRNLGIRIIAEDTGQNFGRTIEFFPATGELLIKSVGKENRII